MASPFFLNENMTKLAIVGATGAVGVEILKLLQEREFPVEEIRLFASEHSAGKKLNFKKQKVVVEKFFPGCFKGLDLVLLSAGSLVSEQICPKIIKEGATAIDNSSAFRYDSKVPLVVPEINPQKIKPGIIANPNCSTIQMLMVLKPIYDNFGIEQLVISTYQAVSGSGYKAITELNNQLNAFARGEKIIPRIYEKQIAYNAIPKVDRFIGNGYTKEEMKMVWETHKIFDDTSIKVTATAVRIPVIIGHSESVFVKTKNKVNIFRVKEVLHDFEGVQVVDNSSDDFPTALDSVNTDKVLVGRIRKDLFDPTAINLWIVANNLRKGAALNAVQIAEKYREKYL
ncbi:MAG: aspartate-semialdehyde dehydrogenase [Candidatus Cloacimonadota bacterium]|nr:aspartate-semialdehyde dehydrogenase [Candidatus Cloacimonadota bacterium]